MRLMQSVTKTRYEIWDWRALVARGKCALCASPNAIEVARRQDGLPILECKDCGLAYVDPRPSAEQIRNYYSSDYFQGKRDFFAGSDYCEIRDKAIASRSVTGYYEVVSNLDLKDKAVLDLGCGSGALLKLLSLHNPAKLVGIDVAEYPVAYGKSRYGLDLRCNTLEAAAFPAGSFDLILMIDFIEHVEDLPDFLSEVGRVLRESGYIFLITPNYRAFSAAKSRWRCLYENFEHLQYLSPISLIHIATKVDLRVTRWWTRGIPEFLLQYPRLHRVGFHRLLHPRRSVSNLVKKLRYAAFLAVCADSGYDLCAILTKD